MAVNALVIRNGIPVPVKREQFLHMDEGLSISIGSNNVYRGNGKVYLTNFRLIFLKREPSRQFSSFSLPYLFIIKHKYNKKLLGGPIISGTVKSVINGGLPNNTKWSITFNDNNTGKAFYSLLEKELNKLNNPQENVEKYKRVINTPTLSVQQIFPDQYAQFQRQQNLKQQGQAAQNNVVLGHQQQNKHRQIIVGQSADDAPMQLTADFRAQKAKLFSSSPANSNANALGPVTGASPVNINAFTKHRVGKTSIRDETAKYDVDAHVPAPNNNAVAAPAAHGYNAYIDPANPDDIVLSVPMNDNEFVIEDEGKSNDNYTYGIGQKYDEKHKYEVKKKNIAVSVGVDDDDDFEQRPKVQPAAIGTVAAKKQKVVDNPWDDDAKPTTINDAFLSGNNGNVPIHWQQFVD